MRGFFIFIALLAVGVKYGVDYLRSFEFQAYAEKTRAPWICQLDNTTAEFQMVSSDYSKAFFHFQRTLKRCSEDPGLAEEAEYGSAKALEGMGRPREAVIAYKAFAQKYPKSSRARTATRAADVIGAS